jgi:hypothetical protein
MWAFPIADVLDLVICERGSGECPLCGNTGAEREEFHVHDEEADGSSEAADPQVEATQGTLLRPGSDR